jgi:hypothetical protein
MMLKVLTNISHFLLGFLAALLGYEWLLTAVYILYQLIDYYCSRDCEEVGEDIVEYVVGLIIGIIVKRALHM